MTSLLPKAAIVSHVLPPSSSGQAVVLHRLLSALPPDRYCLLSRQEDSGAGAGETGLFSLPATHHRLSPVPRLLPLPGRLQSSRPGLLLSALAAVRRRAAEIEAVLRVERCDLVIGSSGDLHDIPAAFRAARRAGVPFLPYLFDDYVYQWTGPSRDVARWLGAPCLRGAAGAIVPNEHLEEEIRRRYDIEGTVLRNPCPLPSLVALDFHPRPFPPGGKAIVYAGAVYHAHYDAFRNLARALRLLGDPSVTLHVFTAQDPSELRRAGVDGEALRFHPHLTQAEILPVLRHADLLFLPLAFDSPIPEVIRTSAPGKMGEYLSVARPILVHAPPDSFLSWFFRSRGCGAVADRNDPRDLAQILARLLSDEEFRDRLGRTARGVAEVEFDLDKIRISFETLLRDAVTRDVGSGRG